MKKQSDGCFLEHDQEANKAGWLVLQIAKHNLTALRQSPVVTAQHLISTRSSS